MLKTKLLKTLFVIGSCSALFSLAACNLTNNSSVDSSSDISDISHTSTSDPIVTPSSTSTSMYDGIHVTGVTLNVPSLDMDIGESQTLVATVLPEDATNKNVSWFSSNKSVATVSDSGVVQALKGGTTTITVKTADLNYSATCIVTVNKGIVAVSGVSLNTSKLSLGVSEVAYLTATVSPEDAANKKVTFSSSDNDTVSVNFLGKVTANQEGSATITVKTEDGGFTDTCIVTVAQTAISVTGVTLSYETASLYVGKTMTLTVSIEPSNATNQEISWSTSNKDVATVTNGTVEGLDEGTATITATTVDGGYTASCVFTISKESSGGGYIPDDNDDNILVINETVIASSTPNSDNEYEFNISKNYKQIYVNAPDTQVVLNLKGVTLENDENSPIYVADCDSIDISANKNTYNVIKDTRAIYTQDEDGQGKGAIYVENGDLSFKGKGQLDITANYYNGIHGKDDVKVKNLTLNVTAVNHGIKGNDSITITSGIINISCGGDGLHTENSDISSKGKQRGDVTISGGTISINSWGDAVQASYNAIIEEADESVPTSFTAKTNKYSSYNGEIVETSASSFYIKMNSSTYANGNYTYAAYINNNWYKGTYKGTLSSGNQGGGPGGPGGGQSTYYVYQIEKPSNATSFTLYRFAGSNVTSFSTSSYNAVSDAKAFNDAYDMVQISVSSKKITFSSWSNYSSKGADVSCKGLKAENEIYVKGGTLNIEAYDDGIHANNDGSLENGASPLGNVTISGGSTTIKSADDGVHADYTLSITGGYLNVTTSYEGLEGNLIKISGGESYVYATDDGVNATSGKSSPNITVSGGYIDIEVPTSGDTDGIDSNGTYTQTGGTVIVKGPGNASSTNFGAAAVDTDSSVKITSGSLIVFGGIEQTPSSSVTKTLCSSSTVSTGSHTISFTSTSYTTTLKSSSRGCVVYSSLGTATLK